MNGSFSIVTYGLRYDMVRRVAVAGATRACGASYVRDKAVAGEWDTVRGQMLRCEGLPDNMYSGDSGQACDARGRSLPS
eukprot:2493518-Prymnesium_polylepis.1